MRAPPRWHWALVLAMFTTARAEAAIVPTPGCSTVFQDDFESGTLAGYEMSGPRPTVVMANAIAERYSLSSSFTIGNHAERFLPPQNRLRLTVKLDLRSVVASGQGAPIIISLGSRSAGFEPVWLYISTNSGVVPGLTVNARVFRSAFNFEDARYMSLPTRVTLRIDWERATGPGTGLVRIYVDGGLLWTSRATGDTRTTLDSMVIGNQGGDRVGTGNMLMDDLLVETCPGSFPPDAAPAPDVAPPADAAVDDSADRGPRVVGVPDAATVEAGAVNLSVGCACTVGRRTQGPGALALLALAALRPRRRSRQSQRSPRRSFTRRIRCCTPGSCGASALARS